ncbi:MAG TPA: DUF2550 domain-containing protein, partial [Streptosporangiaceae bacterium]|nr:DUF2550 domain-containing protein [Streptosporangiaceae bacterium]
MGGSALAFDAARVLGTVVLVLVAAAVVLAVRRFLIERGGGTVECGLRKPAGPSADQPASHHGRWRLGVAAYQLDELRWYSAFGISARPAYTFGRRSLSVVSRRRPDPEEAVSLGPDRVIVQCRLPSGETFELSLAESALTGLLAWLEAAPPGSHLGWASLISAPFRCSFPTSVPGPFARFAQLRTEPRRRRLLARRSQSGHFQAGSATRCANPSASAAICPDYVTGAEPSSIRTSWPRGWLWQPAAYNRL